jgi:hypothetical protein
MPALSCKSSPYAIRVGSGDLLEIGAFTTKTSSICFRREYAVDTSVPVCVSWQARQELPEFCGPLELGVFSEIITAVSFGVVD